MEDLSALNQPRRLDWAIPNPFWLQDHRFQGRAVLPGVHALEHLARAVRGALPGVPVAACRAIRFDKFLVLPAPDTAFIDTLVELAPSSGGGITAVLLTRRVAAKSGITRKIAHVQACFGTADTDAPSGAPGSAGTETRGEAFQVAPERLYDELVPFGRAFRNIVSPVRIDAQGARATVSGGSVAHADAFPELGSPFPLDAAFHAACAWAQRYCGIVAFPVAMAQRAVRQPTRFGQPYEADIRFSGEEGGRLRFDLDLRDGEGRLCEAVRELAMRDVSGGRRQPPAWIRAGLTEQGHLR